MDKHFVVDIDAINIASLGPDPYICNSYNMGKRDLPDIYAQAQGPNIFHFRHSKNLPKIDVNNSASLYSNGYSL